MSDVNYYSIQEASDKLAIPIQKMRRWDEQGVLVAQRSIGGHRRYPRELIDRLAAASEDPEAERQFKELATVKKSLAEKHRIIQLLLESEHRYRDLVETSHDLIWTTDAQGRFTYLNNAAHDIFGLAPRELLGRCFFDFEADEAHISNRRFLSLLKRHGEVKNFLSHIVNANGDSRWVGVNARVLYDDRRRMQGIRGTIRDITEQHVAGVRLQHLALHDPLTDLPNRIALDQTIEQAIAGGAVGAVVFLDIDHFKYVNDHVGHRAGDQLIKGVGSVLRETVRKSSAEIYRIGGDEFAIHLPKSLREDAVEIADRALDAVRHYRYQAAGQNVVSNLSASAGIALYPFHGNDLGTLLANADIALYQAKDRGRNRHVLFDHDSDSLRSTHRRVHWSKKLRDALDDDRLLLFAQPVVRLTDQSTVHHEVLLRLRGEDGKVILPATFVDTAESLGIMQEFDMRVVEKLLVYMHQNNLGGKRLRFFVNLSRTSISDPHWVKRFVEMLSISKVDPSQLAFEITETAAMTEIGVTLNFIRQLKEMGSRFALDDFGAGFSSFYYLKRFDVDYLKIDGNFIQDLASDNSSQVFVRALNDVARGLNKQVIAEWVETPAVMKILQDMGTEYGQGYLFRQPFALDGPLAEPALAGAA